MITSTEAARLGKSFEGVAAQIADALDFDYAKAEASCNRLDALYQTMLSVAKVSGSADSHLWGLVVTELQLAIARRHLHGKG